MSDFPPDFAVEHDQQVYRPICVRPHVTKDGREIRLIEWATNCPRCGIEFTVSTTMLVRSWRRRCDGCKSTRHVKSDRKLFRAQIRGDEP